MKLQVPAAFTLISILSEVVVHIHTLHVVLLQIELAALTAYVAHCVLQMSCQAIVQIHLLYI